MMAANIQAHMPSSFSILKSPSSETRARLFSTDAEEEFRFLKLRGDLKTMTSNMEFYNVLTSTSGTSAPHYEL
jgi:hypothetical protein